MTSHDDQAQHGQGAHPKAEADNAVPVHDAMGAETVSHKPWYRHIRWWGWILIAIAAVLVVFAGTVGTQALLVKHHEEAAIAVVKDAVKKHRLNDLDGVVADMQKQTRAAKNITNGPLWSFTEKLPGIKGSMRVVRMMTDVVDDMAQDTAPKFADVAQSVDVKSIYRKDTAPSFADVAQCVDVMSIYRTGSSNAETIVKALPELETAAQSLQRYTEEFDRIPTPRIGIVANTLNSSRGMLEETAAQSLQRYTEEFDRIPTPRIGIVANTLNSSRGMLDRADYYMQAAVDEYIPNLPKWLGYEGKQTYAILAMTPGEMRASGGLIGAVGTVTIIDGKIEIGDFEGTAKFPGYHLTARNLSEDENRIYREEGPMSLNYDAR